MSYIPPYFERGKPIEASKLNTIIDLLRQAIVQPGRGYSVTRNWGGTSLSIIDKSTATGSGGGGTAEAFCPFKVTDASDAEGLKVLVQWGVMAGRIPTGMFPNDDPQLKLDITGTCYVYAQIDWDRNTLQSTGCSFTTSTDVRTNTTTSTFQLVATVHVDTTGTDPVIDKIMNVCLQPIESPCGLAAS